MNPACFEIAFTVCPEREQFSVVSGGQTAAVCLLEDGWLDFAVYYTYSELPLHLKGRAAAGDGVRIRMLPYRIELYMNGVLADEEWPCGDHYFGQHEVLGACSPVFSEGTAEEAELPSVLGTFEGAEGWKPEENVFAGDCMPYCHDGVYHLIYLKDRHHHRSKWGRGAHQWSHISSPDFVRWSIHPAVVEIDDPNEGSICTGSWIDGGDRQYLFYTVRSCGDSPAAIRRSVSADGYHYEKDRNFGFVLSERYTQSSARDPKVFRDADGLYHMILTTSLKREQVGCLAHLTSRDLTGWREEAEPFFVAPGGTGEPECPDYFFKDGYYYLVYSLQGKGYYLFSEQPLSGWRAPDNPVIPCKSVPKAAVWRDRLIFAGFDGQGLYGGTLTFMEALVKQNGEFEYRKMDQ